MKNDIQKDLKLKAVKGAIGNQIFLTNEDRKTIIDNINPDGKIVVNIFIDDEIACATRTCEKRIYETKIVDIEDIYFNKELR